MVDTVNVRDYTEGWDRIDGVPVLPEVLERRWLRQQNRRAFLDGAFSTFAITGAASRRRRPVTPWFVPLADAQFCADVAARCEAQGRPVDAAVRAQAKCVDRTPTRGGR